MPMLTSTFTADSMLSLGQVFYGCYAVIGLVHALCITRITRISRGFQPHGLLNFPANPAHS